MQEICNTGNKFVYGPLMYSAGITYLKTCSDSQETILSIVYSTKQVLDYFTKTYIVSHPCIADYIYYNFKNQISIIGIKHLNQNFYTFFKQKLFFQRQYWF
jgi:hypothetical protein